MNFLLASYVAKNVVFGNISILLSCVSSLRGQRKIIEIWNSISLGIIIWSSNITQMIFCSHAFIAHSFFALMTLHRRPQKKSVILCVFWLDVAICTFFLNFKNIFQVWKLSYSITITGILLLVKILYKTIILAKSNKL